MKKILCLFVFSLFLSCEKEIKNIPEFEHKKLVVFGFLSPTEDITIRVDRTYPVFGEHLFEDGIKNASVEIYENGILIEKLSHQKNGIYISNKKYRPKVGKYYSIKVRAEGFQNVESSSELIPKEINIKNVDFTQKIKSILNESFPSRKLILEFDDIQDEDNYYQIILNGFHNKITNDIIVYDFDKPSEIESACGFKSSFSDSFNFSDFCFKNGTKKFIAGVETMGFLQPGGDIKDCDEIILRVRNVSKSFYEFRKSEYDEDGFAQAFKQPYPRYSNIKGGFGIFVTYNEYNLNILK